MRQIVTEGGSGGTSRTKQARLSGPTRLFDRRITVFRGDLADTSLANIVMTQRYASGVHMRCVRPMAMLHEAPDHAAVAVSSLLFGEIFVVFDLVAGWVWGQCIHDSYVGWTRIAGLAQLDAAIASHVIAGPSAPVFSEADIKSHVVTTLPMNARVIARGEVGQFVATSEGFIHRQHLHTIVEVGNDPSKLALGFVGTPYVWGGRTRDGIDCSGLVQAVLRACGLFCPRDSDQQAAAFAVIGPFERRRGDLVVFPGHIGILADEHTLIHATAYWMAVVVEPLAAAIARLPADGFRRPPTSAVTPCSSE